MPEVGAPSAFPRVLRVQRLLDRAADLVMAGVAEDATDPPPIRPSWWLVMCVVHDVVLEHSEVQFSGTSTGAPMSFTKNTTNFAGSVWLAFRETMWTSFLPS